MDEWVPSMNEERFFELLRIRREATPDWFIKIKRGGPAWDARGIDAFAFIRPLVGMDRKKVPIQILNAPKKRWEYNKKHPTYLAAGVVTIVVRADRTDDFILQQLFERLEAVRKNDTRFDEFLKREMEHSLNEKGLGIKEKLRASRKSL